MEQSIQVSVRFKPLQPGEESDWSAIDGRLVHCAHTKDAFAFGLPSLLISSIDRVYDGKTSTQAIFDESVKSLVNSALSGMNATVFAYGQTASGKTYTVRGREGDPGLVSLAVEYLFAQVEQEKSRGKYHIQVSYIELYNEAVNDLLDESGTNLEVKESLQDGVYIKGVATRLANSAKEALECLSMGDNVKKVGETMLNTQSSRSHTIFRVWIRAESAGEEVNAAGTIPGEKTARISQLNIVDLAGSEGANRTKAEGVRLREGANINKSLLALSNVIHRLSKAGGKFVNYRDSKLTRILQPALGGNSKTAIVCTVSLSRENYQETLNTLLFGMKAKRVKNTVRVNEISQSDLETKLQLAVKEIERLRSIPLPPDHIQELEKLRQDVAAAADRESSLSKQLSESQKEALSLRGQVGELQLEVLRKADEVLAAKKAPPAPTPQPAQDVSMVEKEDGITLLDLSSAARKDEEENLKKQLELALKEKTAAERRQEQTLGLVQSSIRESVAKCEQLWSDLQKEKESAADSRKELARVQQELVEAKSKAQTTPVGCSTKEIVEDIIREKDSVLRLQRTVSEQKIKIQSLTTQLLLEKGEKLKRGAIAESSKKEEDDDVIVIEDETEGKNESDENRRLIGELDTMYAEIQEDQKTIAELRAENQRISSELAEGRSQTESARRELERFNVEARANALLIQEKTLRIEIYDKERTQLKADIVFYRGEAMKAKRELERMGKERHRQGMRLAAEPEPGSDEASAEILSLKAEIARLTKENQRLAPQQRQETEKGTTQGMESPIEIIKKLRPNTPRVSGKRRATPMGAETRGEEPGKKAKTEDAAEASCFLEDIGKYLFDSH